MVAAAPPPDFDIEAKLIGSPTAPIKMEVYSSFACPHCKDFHEHVMPSIIRDYVTPGKLAIIPRECFPSSQYMALEAANEATGCARIGKYQAVADALFLETAGLLWIATGTPWSAVSSVLKPEEQKRVQAMAKDAGVMAEVQHDLKLATVSNVDRTPTLIITGPDGRKYPLPAACPITAIFKSLVDSLPAENKWRTARGSPEEIRRNGSGGGAEFIASYYEGLRGLAHAAEAIDLGAVCANLLAGPVPGAGAAFDELLAVIRDHDRGTTKPEHNAHPRFFRHVSSPGAPVAVDQRQHGRQRSEYQSDVVAFGAAAWRRWSG